MTTTTRRRAALFLAGLVALSGCGDDKADPVKTTTVQRYCELARQFDDSAKGAGVTRSGEVLEGSPDAVGRLLDQMGPTLDEMKQSAPKDVRGAVADMVEALRQARDGNADALKTTKLREATEKISAFRARSCSTAATSGEG